ncbi:toxin YoeB [Devosia insulae DS-56]|uniref:Putative mRNA interferase YoeB n=1 Tax=Devosia insulae DS-56 TaxID=1116389 RepID=A0A1E5XRE9_9HYPH|nr:Txe/YoeB family addiction module toxin [Devosia insulae]OEO31176.1 toxin YoeB [Devosia insulae DS-56]
MRIIFDQDAWADYQYWAQNDRAMLKRLNRLIEDCIRSPFSGIGKPEALREDFSGWWSRRIDEEHRLVYRVDRGDLLIAQCRFHYHK